MNGDSREGMKNYCYYTELNPILLGTIDKKWQRKPRNNNKFPVLCNIISKICFFFRRRRRIATRKSWKKRFLMFVLLIKVPFPGPIGSYVWGRSIDGASISSWRPIKSLTYGSPPDCLSPKAQKDKQKPGTQTEISSTKAALHELEHNCYNLYANEVPVTDVSSLFCVCWMVW